jgi:hypothetical protein
MARPLIAFVGPSLRRAQVPVGVEVRPPARRGDVLRALEAGPKAIALLDGVFEASPSVWHRELLAALERGVAVFGGASMGALRAAELDSEGMVGVGTIYRWYRDGLIDDDAEVALLHADAEHDFQPVSLPLVNVRHAAAQARAARVLTRPEAQALVSAARGLFYARRSWGSVLEATAWPRVVRARWDGFAARGIEDLKAADARACLDAALAFVRAGVQLPSRPQAAESSWSRWLALEGEDPVGSAEVTDQVLARKVLAGVARGFGLDRAWRGAAASGGAAAEAEAALAARVLDAAARLIPDGPSRAEAAATAGRERRKRRRR